MTKRTSGRRCTQCGDLYSPKLLPTNWKPSLLQDLCAPCYVERRKLMALSLLAIENELLHLLYTGDECPCEECAEIRELLGRD